MTQSSRVIVIGAGICGLSAAIWLRRSGHEVTLIDREGPGAGASYGNAGLMAQWAMVPVNTPGIAKTGLKYMLNPKSPLFMQWAYMPRMVPWLLKFMSHATPDGLKQMVDGLLPILADGMEQHQALVRGTSAEKWLTTSDFSFVYPSRTAYEKDAMAWNIRREAGYAPEIIEGPAVQEAEPILSTDMSCMAVTKGHGHIHNPGAYMIDLAEVLKQEGGTVLKADALDITLTNGRISAVVTDRGVMECDHAVLAAGIWSKPLMRKLGLKVPLEAERGYHLQFINPSEMPNDPMMMTSGKFGVNPMSCGLRCAGTVELGGIDKEPSRAPLKLIAEHAKKAFPRLQYDRVEEWVGFRPSTPDSLPLIGEIGQSGVYASFGHQHIGLTAGPKSGRIVADLLSGKRPNIDLRPYDANRFNG